MIRSEVKHSVAFIYYLRAHKEILCKYEKTLHDIHSNAK